jgi:hypothetical protein
MAELTADERNALVRRWFWDYLGRGPKREEQIFRAEQIRANGLDLTLAAIVDSEEARLFRQKRGW